MAAPARQTRSTLAPAVVRPRCAPTADPLRPLVDRVPAARPGGDGGGPAPPIACCPAHWLAATADCAPW